MADPTLAEIITRLDSAQSERLRKFREKMTRG